LYGTKLELLRIFWRITRDNDSKEFELKCSFY